MKLCTISRWFIEICRWSKKLNTRSAFCVFYSTSWTGLLLLSRINNWGSTPPQAGWFLTQKIKLLLQIKLPFSPEKLGLQVLSQNEGWVGVCWLIIAANDTLYGTATSRAKLFVHGQHICNCNFTLSIGTGRQNRLRCLRNGVSLGSVLVILLLNIYL